MGASQFGQELTQEEEDMLVIQMDESFNPDPDKVKEMTKKKLQEKIRKQMFRDNKLMLSTERSKLVNTPNHTSLTRPKQVENPRSGQGWFNTTVDSSESWDERYKAY